MLMKVSVPPPMERHFWEAKWFQVGVWLVAAIAVLFCLRLMASLAVQSKARDLLNRERMRIARGIHDELGARLTELTLEGEVIQTELPRESPVRPKLEALCEKARTVSSAMDEVVWMVNSKRDTLRDFVNFACKHAQRFLSSSPIRCRLDVDAALPDAVLELPVRRSLLLGVKEALNNAAKHSRATEVFLRIHVRGSNLVVGVEDDGTGFEIENTDPLRNGLTNMQEGMNEIGGRCRITSRPGAGCRVKFEVPLPKAPANGAAKGADQNELLDR
jgi:signal transduction histidine kinase